MHRSAPKWRHDTDFAALIGPVARKLWGPENKALSNCKELRWGTRGSKSVNLEKGMWFDHEANEGGGTIDLIRREKRFMENKDAIDWLISEGLIAKPKPGPGKIVATYDYRDEGGKLLSQTCRLDPKDFRNRRPDGNGGWIWDLKNVRRVLYNLPHVVETVARGEVVLVVEGEKDVENLRKLGVVATCNPGGTNKWRPEYNESLRGGDIALVPDNDDTGHAHVNTIGQALSGIAKRVRVLLLPDLPDKSDASDWIAAGGTAEQLWALVDQAPDWQPLPSSDGGEANPDAARAAAEQREQQLIDELARLSRADYDRRRKKSADELGIRGGTLDDLVKEAKAKSGNRRPTQADILVDLAKAAELFHAPDTTSYANIDVNGHRETWPVRSKGFRRWLTHSYFRETKGGAPSSEALQSALNVIEANAQYDAPEHLVHARIGGINGKIYLDLCDEAWRAVEIDAIGWRIVSSPPVYFRRTAGMLPLPEPVTGGSIGALRPFLNVRCDTETRSVTDTDFVLMVSWTLGTFRDCGPYPGIGVSGEQGTAKTTALKFARNLIDPSTVPLRRLPREDRDLFIAANNNHVLGFDNISGIPSLVSDALCSLSTGGGYAARQLYSDDEEKLFDSTKPWMLNGIEDVVIRPDLADRAILLRFDPIPEDERRAEHELWASFKAERPRILGVLLDAVATGLRRLPDIRLPALPRMADFALWATACETALWDKDTFLNAYFKNIAESVATVINADPAKISAEPLRRRT
jgi:hypothetical protein